MCLHPQAIGPIPQETVRVAQAAFPKGNLYLKIHDFLGPLFEDTLFEGLFADRGQPALSPWRLALVTLLQFAEGLSDRQAAEAVRSRIDWKYVLALPLDDPGFDSSVLCEFRNRLREGSQEALLFDTLLTHFKEKQLLKARGRQRTDSTHVLAAVRTLNRLTCVGETLRRALQAVQTVAPDWLQTWFPPAWLERYDRRFEDFRLPSERSQRQELGQTIGRDGWMLLEKGFAPTAPADLREMPAVQVLRQVWVQQYVLAEQTLRWRTAEELPPGAQLISTPYDIEARYSQKRHTQWSGYKIHCTETCEGDTPHLITDVQTTPATTSDMGMTQPIHENLQRRELLPDRHYVDTGYVSAEQLVASRDQYGVNLVGPVTLPPSWQARSEDGYDISRFEIDGSGEKATCPEGKQSVSWRTGEDQAGHSVVHIRFSPKDCRPCPARSQCTKTAAHPRMICVRAQAGHEALEQARARQQTEEFRRDYAARSGIEGTLSQGVRVCHLRRCRYIGLAKTRLEHLLAAAAINLLRLGAWLLERPRSRTRQTPLVHLAGTNSRSMCAS